MALAAISIAIQNPCLTAAPSDKSGTNGAQEVTDSNTAFGAITHFPFRQAERARSVKASAAEKESMRACPLARVWAGARPNAGAWGRRKPPTKEKAANLASAIENENNAAFAIGIKIGVALDVTSPVFGGFVGRIAQGKCVGRRKLPQGHNLIFVGAAIQSGTV
jgi:hypothetical protein